MSLGALSREAHETLAVALNRIGGKSNSGEVRSSQSNFDDKYLPPIVLPLKTTRKKNPLDPGHLINRAPVYNRSQAEDVSLICLASVVPTSRPRHEYGEPNL